ncbi:MAG: hypothetical protein ACBR12_07185 [Microcoleus sp.]
MKNLILLGTLSFSIAFSLSIVVEKNVNRSATIAGIATISTLSSAFVLNKKSERQLKNTHSHTEQLKSIKNDIVSLKNQRRQLVQIIESQTQFKTRIEAEYNSIIIEVARVKEEIKSLNTQRDNLQNVIADFESKHKKYLYLIANKIEPKITIKQEDNSVLGKIQKPQNKIINKTEKNTLYAKRIFDIPQSFWSIYEYNIDTFRSQIPRKDWGHYWNKMAHGVAILSEENTLLTYFAFYGGSHYYKLVYLLDKLFSDLTQLQIEVKIDIIDYGCGQALGTTCLLDYLIHNNLPNITIDSITLIEPSEVALNRGILHINHLSLYSNPINIKSLNKKLQYLKKDDLYTLNQNIKLHIFSNILDVTGFEINNLANTIKESQSGINYFICVSPTDLHNRIQLFFDFWNKTGCPLEEIQLSSEDLYYDTWRFKSDKFQRDKIHRVQKLFYVNL